MGPWMPGIVGEGHPGAAFAPIASPDGRRMAIDEPLDKIRPLVKDADFFGASLQIGGLLTPFLKFFSIARGILDTQLAGDSAKVAICALCDELQRLQSRWPSDFESALDTVWFRRAITVLMDEACRATNNDYACLLGRVAAHGCFPIGQDAHRQDDLASYIRDLARLGTDDIQFLTLLRDAYRKVKVGHHDGYAGQYDTYKKMAAAGGFQEDDR